jgi:hypothetical protein
MRCVGNRDRGSRNAGSETVGRSSNIVSRTLVAD